MAEIDSAVVGSFFISINALGLRITPMGLVDIESNSLTQSTFDPIISTRREMPMDTWLHGTIVVVAHAPEDVRLGCLLTLWTLMLCAGCGYVLLGVIMCVVSAEVALSWSLCVRHDV